MSDDEDDVHPNIDKESWFRMKHRSRVEREDREEADKKRINEEMKATNLRISEITRTLDGLNKAGDGSDSDDEDLEDKDGLEAELAELRKANQARQDKLDEYEKNKKWNVDNICHVVEERTIINKKTASKFSESGYVVPEDEDEKVDVGKADGREDVQEEKPKTASISSTPSTNIEKLSVTDNDGKPTKAKEADKKKQQASAIAAAGPEREHIAMMSYHDFTQKYDGICEEFMAITSLEKSRDFLIQNGHILLQENASSYLLLATLEDEMNGFHEKMKQTARQSQIISNITELAKSMHTHPGNVINPFFMRLEQKETMTGFIDGVNSFIKNIEKRAVTKRKEMDAERESEAKEALERGEGVDLADIPREQRLGPGGLDPVEVLESLPLVLQKAFESREVEKLQEALTEMPLEEAERHMKRCVDAGLWNQG